jgi:Ser/Thr protein kinase RdoA (MazF antagonist)
VRVIIPPMNILLEPETMLPALTTGYDLRPPVACELIRRGFNDHYRVRAGESRYVLRVYLNGKYYIESTSDFRFELDLLRFLAGEGVPVSSPVPRKDGDPLGEIETPAGRRSLALFTFAEGEARKDLDPSQARKLGETVAALHRATDRFRTDHHRYHLDLRYLLDQPMELMASFLRRHGREEDLHPYLSRIAELREQIAALPTTRGAYGIIHGDLHGGNFHLTGDGGLTLFDFDHCGYGWRIYDLAACRGSMEEGAWEAFLGGYRSLRPVSEAEIAAVPALRKARAIWDKGDILAMQPAWGEQFGEKFADEIAAMFPNLFPA